MSLVNIRREDNEKQKEKIDERKETRWWEQEEERMKIISKTDV